MPFKTLFDEELELANPQETLYVEKIENGEVADRKFLYWTTDKQSCQMIFEQLGFELGYLLLSDSDDLEVYNRTSDLYQYITFARTSRLNVLWVTYRLPLSQGYLGFSTEAEVAESLAKIKQGALSTAKLKESVNYVYANDKHYVLKYPDFIRQYVNGFKQSIRSRREFVFSYNHYRKMNTGAQRKALKLFKGLDLLYSNKFPRGVLKTNLNYYLELFPDKDGLGIYDGRDSLDVDYVDVSLAMLKEVPIAVLCNYFILTDNYYIVVDIVKEKDVFLYMVQSVKDKPFKVVKFQLVGDDLTCKGIYTIDEPLLETYKAKLTGKWRGYLTMIYHKDFGRLGRMGHLEYMSDIFFRLGDNPTLERLQALGIVKEKKKAVEPVKVPEVKDVFAENIKVKGIKYKQASKTFVDDKWELTYTEFVLEKVLRPARLLKFVVPKGSKTEDLVSALEQGNYQVVKTYSLNDSLKQRANAKVGGKSGKPDWKVIDEPNFFGYLYEHNVKEPYELVFYKNRRPRKSIETRLRIPAWHDYIGDDLFKFFEDYVSLSIEDFIFKYLNSPEDMEYWQSLITTKINSLNRAPIFQKRRPNGNKIYGDVSVLAQYYKAEMARVEQNETYRKQTEYVNKVYDRGL